MSWEGLLIREGASPDERASPLLEKAGWWKTLLWHEPPPDPDHAVRRAVSSKLREPDRAGSEEGQQKEKPVTTTSNVPCRGGRAGHHLTEGARVCGRELERNKDT